MATRMLLFLTVCLVALSGSRAGEKSIATLKDFCTTELKSAGLEVSSRTTVHLTALGGGGSVGWSYQSDEMFAYGWIVNAATRAVVWEMTVENTSGGKGRREFDGTVTLDAGKYEAYFTVPVFGHHTWFSHILMNIDHREKPLFGGGGDDKMSKFFKNWFTDDMAADWKKKCKEWGMELRVDDSAPSVKTFPPPLELPRVVVKITGMGEDESVAKAFAVDAPLSLSIYALGEGAGDGDLVDRAWIVDAASRRRVWEMESGNVVHAGGAEKNKMFEGEVNFPKGEYVLYYGSDDSHSCADWNAAPPYDPGNWGVTLMAANEADLKKIRLIPYQEFKNVIVRLTRMKDDESRSEGFTLKQDSDVRVYAIGERSNSRREMADEGFILDARTRTRVWTMDVDRTSHAGGASKNCMIDEVVRLPRGSYTVTYNTDDSHAYGDWNSSPPSDPENYGITVMGAGDRFDMAVVGKFVEQTDKNLIAQIIKVRDDAEKVKSFRLDKTTRVRVYAIGEGQNRQMYDYGWIEDVKTGNTVWEMTYSMTFHAGGHRKNRMVNTTITLDRGEYTLHYVSDDSHSYGDWNVDPPDDQQYWGITLYRDDGMPTASSPPEAPSVPEAPAPPAPPKK